MVLDVSNFPFVRVSLQDKADSDAGLSAFETLLDRQQAFVMLSIPDQSEDEETPHEDTREERKQTTLWMKKHMVALRAYVKGMVQTEPSTAKRLAIKTFLPVFSKFWGFPLIIAESEEMAKEMAHKLLAGAQAA